MSTLEFQQQLVGLRQQLYYFALSLTKDRDNALDLLQESLMRALTYRDKRLAGFDAALALAGQDVGHARPPAAWPVAPDSLARLRDLMAAWNGA